MTASTIKMINGVGIVTIELLPIDLKKVSVLSPVIVAPLPMYMVTERAIMPMASVTMNGGTLTSGDDDAVDKTKRGGNGNTGQHGKDQWRAASLQKNQNCTGCCHHGPLDRSMPRR